MRQNQVSNLANSISVVVYHILKALITKQFTPFTTKEIFYGGNSAIMLGYTTKV